MASAVAFDQHIDLATTMILPAGRGVFSPGGLIVAVRQALPTDAIGVHTLTLTNVVVGSRIHIRDQDDTTALHDEVAATSTVEIAIPVYAPGSPLNDWVIRVRKASSAPTYRPYETLMVATPGESSIYVSQIPDE